MKAVVIGAGPAGESAARTLARNKAHVTLIEKEHVGGLCLNRGCIPSKTLLSFGKKISDYRRSLAPILPPAQQKIQIGESAWQEIKKEKKAVVEKIRAQIQTSIRQHKIELIQGEAKFLSPHEIILSHSPSQKISFDKAVIAIGSAPLIPAPFNQHARSLLNSDQIFDLERIPKSMLIVGGGAVGCEFACLFHELGTEITIIEMKENLLPGEDPLIVGALRKSFEKRGIKILDSLTVREIFPSVEGWNAAFSDGTSLSIEKILVCVGRAPYINQLDLEKAGIRYSLKGIETDSTLRTTNPNIYAVGDINGLSLLAHAGSVQGECAAANALGIKTSYDGQNIPRCLYTWPEVASVGMWLSDTSKSGIDLKSCRFFLEASGKALAEGEVEGLIQIVYEKTTEQILGAQIIGPHATEMIHILSVAIHQKMTRKDLCGVVFAHPTLSEGIRSALMR